MKIVLIASMLLLSTLIARDNPFEPIIKEVPKEQNLTQVAPKKVPIDVFKEVNATSVWKKPIEQKSPETKPAAKPIVAEKPKVKIKKPIEAKKTAKRASKPYWIYTNPFIRIKLDGNRIKIYTKDKILNQTILKNPNRIVVDFERFDVLNPLSKKLKNRYIKAFEIGHHDYFYRTVFTLKYKKRFKLKSTSYGYLITIF